MLGLPGLAEDLVTWTALALEGAENWSVLCFASLLANMITARKKGFPNEVERFKE